MSTKGEVDIFSVLEELVVHWGAGVIEKCPRVLQECKRRLRALPMLGTSRETRIESLSGTVAEESGKVDG